MTGCIHTAFHTQIRPPARTPGGSPVLQKAIHEHCLLDQLCSSSPRKHAVLTSYSGPQTSHWSWSLYSDPGAGSEPWDFEQGKEPPHRYLCYFERLANTRTKTIKDTYSFLQYLLLKHFPSWSLDLSHKTPKPTDKHRHMWCFRGTAKSSSVLGEREEKRARRTYLRTFGAYLYLLQKGVQLSPLNMNFPGPDVSMLPDSFVWQSPVVTMGEAVKLPAHLPWDTRRHTHLSYASFITRDYRHQLSPQREN